MSYPVTSILISARALIKRPKRWTQGATARDAQGNWIDPCQNAVVSRCCIGALMAAAHSKGYATFEAADVFRRVVGYRISEWNDDPKRTHAEVMDAFGRAISKATTATP